MDDQGPAPSNRRDESAPALDPLLAAILTLSGEVGYLRAGPELIAERSGSSVGALYSRYTSREECFATAYEARAEPLARAMLNAGRDAPDLAGCIEAALAELFDFAGTEPLVARAILAEVYVAGGAARAKHEMILRRLSDAVAGTRRESHPSRHDPPPVTAAFIVGGIEEVVRRRVGERRPELLWNELPGLLAFVAGPLSGGGLVGD
jgi:AcrR family transcriptional regulator